MRKRMILMLVIVIAFIAIIGAVKYSQIKTAMAQQGAFQPPPEAVTTIVAKAENWDTSLNAIGTVVAVNGVTVSADLPGVVERIAFESGQRVNQRDVLVTLDAKQERAQLAAANAQVDLTRVQLERASGLRAKDIVAQAVVDQNAAEAKQAAAREVRVTSDGFAGVAVGKVTAIDSVVDESTRNVRVQAVFDNRDLRLRPGMFVQAQLAHGTSAPVVTVPTSSISYAPFGDSVFIVENMKGPDGKTYRGVRQQFVKLGPSRGDVVSVLSGVKPGEEVVTSGVFKLRPGAAVVVNNKVQPGNNIAPKPEDS